MMEVLYERGGLKLSKKKTRIGKTEKTFHFLGIQYPGTQPLDNTDMPRSNKSAFEKNFESDLFFEGKNKSSEIEFQCTKNVSGNFFPHERTLRKARMQVNIMVYDGLSANRIRNYLHHWVLWWLRTTGIWTYDDLLKKLIDSCWPNNPAISIAKGLLLRHTTRRLTVATANPNTINAVANDSIFEFSRPQFINRIS